MANSIGFNTQRDTLKNFKLFQTCTHVCTTHQDSCNHVLLSKEVDWEGHYKEAKLLLQQVEEEGTCVPNAHNGYVYIHGHNVAIFYTTIYTSISGLPKECHEVLGTQPS